jgi:hypothetical protein
MRPDPVALDEPLAIAVQELVQQWLRRGKRLDSYDRASANGGGATSPINQLIRVSSATPDSFGSPCYVQFWDGTAWSDAANQARAITPLVDTLSQSTISPGSQTVTPDSMVGITVGLSLLVDPETANSESVTVTAVTSTTFDATFANSHSGTPIQIQANGTLVTTIYKARLMRVESNGMFIYAVSAAESAASRGETIKDDKGGAQTSTVHKVNNSVVTLVGGEAVTTIDDASATASGLVNLTSGQIMGSGDKKFTHSILANQANSSDAEIALIDETGSDSFFLASKSLGSMFKNAFHGRFDVYGEQHVVDFVKVGDSLLGDPTGLGMVLVSPAASNGITISIAWVSGTSSYTIGTGLAIHLGDYINSAVVGQFVISNSPYSYNPTTGVLLTPTPSTTTTESGIVVSRADPFVRGYSVTGIISSNPGQISAKFNGANSCFYISGGEISDGPGGNIKYGIQLASGKIVFGATGTSGGGDDVNGGIITALGTGSVDVIQQNVFSF